ncbi:hypothetical protein C7S15_6582 [Burkholderia cepacia]|nr:hypothetical protein [Burkholderia cepacia]
MRSQTGVARRTSRTRALTGKHRRGASANRPRRHPPRDFFSGLARDYWRVIKGFP